MKIIQLLEYYRPMRLPNKAVVLIVLLWTGCSADLEALYADEEALIALLPAKPDDEVAAACGMCAKQECEKKRLECEKDDLCSKLLECKGGCSDPACLFECEADHAARGEHNNYHTCLVDRSCTQDTDCDSECEAEHQASETYDAYHACVFEQECKKECATGENWQCLGDYSWPRPGTGHAPLSRLTVMVKYSERSDFTDPGATGVNVEVCALAVICGASSSAVSNGYGIAVLEDLPLNDDGAFDGYLRFSRDPSDDDGIEQIRAIGRPICGELTMEEVVTPKADWLDEIEVSTRISPDRNAAHIKARVYDCLNAPATGISFSLARNQVGIGYYNDTSDFAQPGTETNETGMGGFGNVKLGITASLELTIAWIRAVRTSDGALVAEHQTHVMTDTLTRVDLYPLETSPRQQLGL